MQVLDNLPITSRQISQASRADPILSTVAEFILQGWPDKHSISRPELQVYYNHKDELSLHQGCILWGSRVVVPAKYQEAVLDELHQNHPGIVRMKSLARSYVWWPGIDSMIENSVLKYYTCQQAGNKPQNAPLHPLSWSDKPWDRIHLDFAGPYEGKMILVIVDSGSKYVDAHVMTHATSNTTVEQLHHTFALLGLPRIIITDNGTQFTGEPFQTFCVNNGIKHVCTSAYHPASNGMAERTVRTLL